MRYGGRGGVDSETRLGYRRLKSFQVARLIYDVTVRFCDRYVDQRSRTYDQMVQAARSVVQNIPEGSQASGTSKKTEIKLTGVARSAQKESPAGFPAGLWVQEQLSRAAIVPDFRHPPKMR